MVVEVRLDMGEDRNLFTVNVKDIRICIIKKNKTKQNTKTKEVKG